MYSDVTMLDIEELRDSLDKQEEQIKRTLREVQDLKSALTEKLAKLDTEVKANTEAIVFRHITALAKKTAAFVRKEVKANKPVTIDVKVNDSQYDGSWENSKDAPTQDAVYRIIDRTRQSLYLKADKAYVDSLGIGGGSGASVSDAAYDSSWNGIIDVAPSKNAVYDKIESIPIYTDEAAQDAVGSALTNTTSINLTYNDGANTISAAANFGSSAGTVCQGNDSRLSDARTPTAHAASHKSGGSDSIRLDELAATTDNTNLNATTSAHGLLRKLNNNATQYLNGQGNWATPPDTTYSVFTSSTNGLVPASGGGTTNFLRADGSWAAPAGGGGSLTIADFAALMKNSPFWHTDCFINTANGHMPWAGVAVNSGTLTNGSASISANHPGVLYFRSSTTANSGYRLMFDYGLSFTGGETFHAIFSCITFANTTTRIGFVDTTTSSDCVDGAYIEINTSGVATAKTANNSTRTSNPTTYSMSTGVWYNLTITANSDATSINFLIKNDAGTTLLNVNNTTNIPTTAARTFGSGVIATNSGTTATDLTAIDYMAFWVANTLTRP